MSLVVGDKLSGQFGGFDIGAFSVLTDKTPTGEDGQILSVARVTHPIFAESKFGFVFTNGDPTGLTDNTVAGADFQYRNSNVFGNKVLQADVYYMKSFSSTAGDDDSAAFSLNFPNEPWSGDFLFKQIGENFTPALGFVNRTAIRQYVGTVTHLTRYREHVSQHARIRHQSRIRHRSERRAGIARQRRLCACEIQDRRSDHVPIDQFVRERAGAVFPAEERADAAGDV